MEPNEKLPADNQDDAETRKSSNKGGLSIVSIIGLVLMLVGAWNFFFSGASESDACKSAELEVQNSVYTSTGIIPKTESTVVYKNKDYICVGVNYTFEDNFKANVYWSRIVCCYRNSGDVRGSSADWGGVDIRNLTKDQMDQIKVFFKLE